ncbi:hypothetical protein EAI_13069 [Harpegnathos saltator]|uniref:Uncharacterized protein n=1 Tax=Harpegnathos saltator TaxID=610380 RepID=E2C7B4_HARSA|nr:hypothetical protein EAI_13069 [Harpegnathos saltator]
MLKGTNNSDLGLTLGHLLKTSLLESKLKTMLTEPTRSVLSGRIDLSSTKEAGKSRKEELMAELYEEAEGLLYGPGIAD